MTEDRATVALVVPPFASAVMPMFGLSLIKSKLTARGIDSKVIYANLTAAKAIGAPTYQEIADSDVRLLWGELLAASSCPAWRYRSCPPARSSVPEHLLAAVGELGTAIEQAALAVAALQPRIVGLSSSFQQNIASILFARHVRRLNPAAMIVIGGANMDAPMGTAFHERFDAEFDHVFSGEADASFPEFCEDVLGNRRTAWPRVIASAPVSPQVFAGVPDFDDYFLQGGGDAQAELAGERILPIELSRGCWWGQKHHCTFCGLNANGMQHRAKPGLVIAAELEQIVRRHAPKLLFATDNIMPLETLRRTTRMHPAAGRDFRFFFETKSNLREEHLDQLVRLGVGEIQPGIESFSTAVLRSLNKGNTGPAHVCLLREAASRQIHVIWNLLVDVPGDQEADYLRTLALLPALSHLPPPTGCTPIRLDRYSPYFSTPEAFGIRNVRPVAAFALLFGHSKAAENMCYFFDADYPSVSRRNPELAKALEEAVAAWRQSWTAPRRRRSLVGLRNRAGDYVVVAQTGGEPPEVTTVPRPDEELLFRTRHPTPSTLISRAEAALLDSYVCRGLVTLFEDHYIYLPTEPWRGFELRAGRCGSEVDPADMPAGPPLLVAEASVKI